MNQEWTEGHFKWLDYVIFLILIVGSLLIGVGISCCSKQISSTKEYLTGSFSIYAVCMSLLGGSVSALSVLGKFIFILTIVL